MLRQATSAPAHKWIVVRLRVEAVDGAASAGCFMSLLLLRGCDDHQAMGEGVLFPCAPVYTWPCGGI